MASVEELIAQGDKLLAEKDYSSALARFVSAGEQKPDLASAFFGAGNAHLGLMEFGKAVEQFERAGKIDPHNYLYPHKEGYAYLRKGVMKNARQAIEKSIQLKADFAPNYYLLGKIHLLASENDSAMDCFDKALSLDKQYADALLGKADTLANMGKVEEAVSAYQQVLSLDPENIDAVYRQGRAYLKLKQFEKAKDSAERALSLKPNWEKGMMLLGEALRGLGR
jgi:tetratricopeptide (TPR) repeat protein